MSRTHPWCKRWLLPVIPTLAIAVLTACGGGGGNGDPGPAVPEPPALEVPRPGEPTVLPQAGTYETHTLSEVAPPGSYANTRDDRIRVVVQDHPLDFTRPEFDGRIVTDGASFGVLLTHEDTARASFVSNCRPEHQSKCQVYRVKSGGDWDRLHALVRTIVQTHGQPPRGGWYLYDEDRYGWVEIPAHDTPLHGTLMGSVIARVAPDAAIVPVVSNRFRGIRRGAPDGSTMSLGYREPKIEEIHSDGVGGAPLELLDERLARNWREFWALGDIVNTSLGGVVTPDEFGQSFLAARLASMRAMRQWLPQHWRAFTQADTPESERTIQVRPTTNARQTVGLGGRGLEMLEIVNFPEMRGHTIGATTGLGGGDPYIELGTPCGELPGDWDAARHGRHYCLAAPETSTSEATAYISGTLANMMARARGQVGSLEIVRRLMNTADRTGKYSNSIIYGAGLVDPVAALQAVGQTVTGTSGGEAPVGRTRLDLPSAYGDAAKRLSGIEVAAFDAWNFPFWIGTGRLMGPSDIPVDPIPKFKEEDDPELCSPFRLHAASFNCFRASDRVAGLVSSDGLGASLRLGDGVAVSALTQSARRLDGVARGAFSWGRGATLAAVHLGKEYAIKGNWRAVSRMTVAADLPAGIGRSRPSMFEAGPSLISSWTLGIAHERGRSRTVLAFSQPPRAETGTARLIYPVGRTRAGQRVYESRSFSIVPSRRTLTARVTHQRVLGAGDLLVSFQRSENPGHTDAAPSYGTGVAWRFRF